MSPQALDTPVLDGPHRDTPLASVIVSPADITVPPEPTPPGTVTPPPGTPLPVLLLVDQARSASGEEQQELARRINRLLDQMARDGRSRHVADWFHELIDSGKLEGLADGAGHACLDTAIQGLLSLGFPYALEIRPEHLERLQARGPRRPRKLPRSQVAAAGVLVGGMVAQLGLDVARSGGVSGLLTLEVGALLLSLGLVLPSAPESAPRNLGLALLLVTSALGIFLGTFTGYAGLVSGLAGLVALLLFAIHES